MLEALVPEQRRSMPSDGDNEMMPSERERCTVGGGGEGREGCLRPCFQSSGEMHMLGLSGT